MILTPVYCNSEPPPASGPVRSKMTPILIFFSWASAPTAIPSMAIAADSPTRRREALRSGMEILPWIIFCALRLMVLIAAYHIGSATRCQAHCSRRQRAGCRKRQSGTSRLGSELRFKKGDNKARHRRIEVTRVAHDVDAG